MRRVSLLVVFVMTFTWSCWAADVTKELDAAAQVVQDMTSSNQVPVSLLKQAKCIAVIPQLTKAGLLVGGEHGNGVVSCRTNAGWGAPGFISISGGSIGLQAGAEHQDIVLLMNERGAQQLRNGHWDLGAEAVAAGPTSSTGHSENTGWNTPVLSYAHSSGAYAGANLGGSKISVDQDTMHNIYGESVTFQAVLDGQVPQPAAARAFLAALQQVAGS